MKLTLDEENKVIGVDQEDSTYEYVGEVPADFAKHQTDGYYMLMLGVLTETPVIDCSTSEAPAVNTQTQQMLTLSAMTLQLQKQVVALATTVTQGGKRNGGA